MEPVEAVRDAVIEELERILASPGFSRNDRLCNFLRFVVQQKIQGKDDQLKETVIGSEVFGRKSDYDPRHDPIVRMEAAKLRTRLAEYYSDSGAADPLQIEIPKGAYIPQWRATIPVRRALRWKLAAVPVVTLCLATAAVFLWQRSSHVGN